MTRIAERIEDMSPRGSLMLLWDDDGDMIVCVRQDPQTPEGHRAADVEFCASGGKSPRTLAALRALYEAIKADNEDFPRAKGRRDSGPMSGMGTYKEPKPKPPPVFEDEDDDTNDFDRVCTVIKIPDDV